MTHTVTNHLYFLFCLGHGDVHRSQAVWICKGITAGKIVLNEWVMWLCEDWDHGTHNLKICRPKQSEHQQCLQSQAVWYYHKKD